MLININLNLLIKRYNYYYKSLKTYKSKFNVNIVLSTS